MLSQGNDFGPKITMRNTASGLSTIHGRVIFDDGIQLASIGYVKPLIGPPGLSFSGTAETNLKITDSGMIGVGGELDPLPWDSMRMFASGLRRVSSSVLRVPPRPTLPSSFT